jgi:hypothetical protein
MLVILMIRDILQTKDIDVLILDLELKVFLVFLKSNQFEKFSKTKLYIQWPFRTDLCTKCD